MKRRPAEIALRIAFAAAFLLMVHDLAGITDADAPTHAGAEPVFRVFAASRAGMLAIAWFFIQHQARDKHAMILIAGLVGLSLNNHWFSYSLDDPFFWPVAILNYSGVGISIAAFTYCIAASYTDSTHSNTDPRALAAAAIALGAVTSIAGLLTSAFVFGPHFSPTIADAGNRLFWVFWIADSMAIVALAVMILRAGHDVGYRTALYGFIVLGSGTALHGTVRLVMGNNDPLWASGIDAACQVAFAILLAIAVFRDRHVLRVLAATRGVRYTAFGAAFGLGFPVLETWFDELIARSPLGTLEALGGEQSAHLVFSAGSSLGIARIDRFIEHRIERLKTGEEIAESPGSPAA